MCRFCWSWYLRRQSRRSDRRDREGLGRGRRGFLSVMYGKIGGIVEPRACWDCRGTGLRRRCCVGKS